MAATPENKIKKAVRIVLKQYDAYYFMPVQMGLGAPALDFYACLHGTFFAVETKAPPKPNARTMPTMTPRQELTANAIRAAGGKVFLVYDDATITQLVLWIERVVRTHKMIQDKKAAAQAAANAAKEVN